MFTLDDMITFVWAFFITLPIVAVIHSAGHFFFAKIFEGKTNIVLGKGRSICSFGIFELRLLYFVDSESYYQELKIDNRLTHCLVYAGGVIFNGLFIILVNTAIYYGYLPKHQFFYQFVYFSLYYIFFALLPIQYGKDHVTDGKAIWNIIKNGKPTAE
ncbi:hypothetical protein KHA88_01145 [Bacillus sp. FJAT-49754]|nr:hypothetical protein [Lederbergia citrea]